MKKNRYLCEAVICLPHDISYKMNLTNEYKKRILLTIQIFKKTNSRFIIFTGGRINNKMHFALSDYAQIYLNKKLSIKEELILKEKKSKDTIGDAIFSFEMIKKHQISKLHVVTSDWHIPRVKKIFKKIYGNNFKFIFYSINGAQKYINNERKNVSLNNFISWSKKCDAGDLKCLKFNLFRHHKLYNN